MFDLMQHLTGQEEEGRDDKARGEGVDCQKMRLAPNDVSNCWA